MAQGPRDQAYTNKSAHVYGLGSNFVRVAATSYSTTEILGIWVEAQPTADDSAITPVGGGAAVTAIDAAAFVEGAFLPLHASSVTVGTGGEFILIIPDA